MIEIIDLVAGFVSEFLLKQGHNLPADVVTAVRAAIDALNSHKDDLITKANLEAERN